MRHRLTLWILLLLAAITTPWGRAGAADDPEVEVFARRYATGVNAKDAGALRRLMHPASLACVRPENEDVYRELMARALARPIPSGYRVTARNLRDAEPLPFTDMVTYPVRPTREVRIDFERGPTSSTTVIRWVAPIDGALLEVVPCPTAAAVEAFRDGRVRAAARAERARGLAAGLTDPLLSELRGLLREGRRIEAMKRFGEATGEDLVTAREVLSIVAPEEER